MLNVTFSDIFMLAEMYQGVNATGNSFCVYFIRNKRVKAVLGYIFLFSMSLSLHPVQHPNCKQVPRSAKDSMFFDFVGNKDALLLRVSNYFVDVQWKFVVSNTNTSTFCVSPVFSV